MAVATQKSAADTALRPFTGGHVAAWEQPELLSEDVRATFRSVR